MINSKNYRLNFKETSVVLTESDIIGLRDKLNTRFPLIGDNDDTDELHRWTDQGFQVDIDATDFDLKQD